MEEKPKIGITSTLDNEGRMVVYSSKVNVIKELGGIPIILPYNLSKETAGEYIKELDGLLLTGGSDINPLIYGEEPIQDLGETEYDRDISEIMIYQGVFEKGKPILGICRGMQLINVAMGGTIEQDIFQEKKGVLKHRSTENIVDGNHSVDLLKGTKIAEVYGCEEIVTNSMHHQAVKRIGEGLKVTARAKDGVAEAIEYVKEDKFVMGVQYHPEAMMGKYPEHKGVFKLFVDACKKD